MRIRSFLKEQLIIEILNCIVGQICITILLYYNPMYAILRTNRVMQYLDTSKHMIICQAITKLELLI